MSQPFWVAFVSQALALHYLQVPFEIRVCSESDPDICKLLKVTLQYIGKPATEGQCQGDMVTRELTAADLDIGTSPCQDYSSAGLNAGRVLQSNSLANSFFEKWQWPPGVAWLFHVV